MRNIGLNELREMFKNFYQSKEHYAPAEVIREFNLQKPRFAEMCRKGLFA